MKTTALYLLAIVAVAGSAYSVVASGVQQRIAFVQMEKVVYGYAGMQEAQGIYSRKALLWDRELDAVDKRMQMLNNQYRAPGTAVSATERSRGMDELNVVQEENVRRRQEINDSARIADSEMTQGILGQIKGGVERYAQRNGYDIIMCATASNPILPGTEGVDLTDEVLRFLNEEYVE